MKQLFENTKARAIALLAEPPIAYDPKNLRINCIQINNRALELGLMYHLTGEKRFAERLWRELDNLCSYPHWNEEVLKDYLNCGNLSAAAGIAYDWCHDYLTPEQRQRVVQTIMSRSIDSTLRWYDRNVWWSKSVYNWNGVCNGGVSLAALAIIDENDTTRDPCSRLLERTLTSLKLTLDKLEPDGGGDEGIPYQSYGLMHLFDLVAGMPNVFGTEYGFGDYPGFAKAGDFLVYLSGSATTFNFGDNRQFQVLDPRQLLYTRRWGSPLPAARYYKYSKLEGTARDLLWFVAVPEHPAVTVQDRYFRGTEAVGMHTNLLGDDDVFVGFKAGGVCAHGDNDRGTFFLTAMGEVWATDLGADKYEHPGYFDVSDDSKRWLLYRKSAQGHNTLVLNPGLQADQKASATARIERFRSGSDYAFAVAELTSVYPNASGVKRGVWLDKATGTVTVCDEIAMPVANDVWWFMHADAQCKQINPREIALEKNGKLLRVQLLGDAGTIEVMDAAPLPGTASISGQMPNPGIRKLAIHLRHITATTIDVRLIPDRGDNLTRAIVPSPPLAKWN